MRSYTVAVTSLAIDAPERWTDNVLCQFVIPGVISVRRGIARKLPHAVVVRLAIIRQLNTSLGVGVGDAIRLTADLLRSEPVGVFESGQLKLVLNMRDVERSVDARLAAALESSPIRRRGRPPRRPGS